MPLVLAVAPSLSYQSDHILFIGTVSGCYRMVGTESTCQVALADIQVHTVAIVPDVETDSDEPEHGGSAIFLGTEYDGVVCSSDGAERWEGANAGLMDLSVLALAFSPSYVQDRTGFAATTSGLYRTRNGGRAWRLIEMPEDEIAVQCLAVSPSFSVDGLVFAGTEERGLYRSIDAGTTWAHVGGLGTSSVNALAISFDGKTMVAGTDRGAAVTLDGGTTWRWDEGKLGPALSVCLISLPDRTVIVAGLLTNGIGISSDEGMTWALAPSPMP